MKKFHLKKDHGKWLCIAPEPYGREVPEYERSSHGETPFEAYKNLMYISSVRVANQESTPRLQRLHELWQHAEARRFTGTLASYSPLDNAVRNGGKWL